MRIVPVELCETRQSFAHFNRSIRGEGGEVTFCFSLLLPAFPYFAETLFDSVFFDRRYFSTALAARSAGFSLWKSIGGCEPIVERISL